MRPVLVSRQLAAAAVGAVCASQTPAGAGNLVLNGTLAVTGPTQGPTISTGTLANTTSTYVQLDVQRNIGITSAANLSALTFTIKGTDQQGRVVSEVLTGPNITTVTSVLNYYTVTQIAVSGAAAGALTVDTVATGASGEIVMDIYEAPVNAGLSLEVASGAGNWTVQYTLNNVSDGTNGPYTWYPVSGMSALAANTAGSVSTPLTALRLLTNSGTGKANLFVVQSGDLT